MRGDRRIKQYVVDRKGAVVADKVADALLDFARGHVLLVLAMTDGDGAGLAAVLVVHLATECNGSHPQRPYGANCRRYICTGTYPIGNFSCH